MKAPLLPADGTKPAGMASNGVKLDAGKVRFDLLPPDALHAVAQVYTFGADKYEPRNWEKGMDWGRVFAAGQRHMNAFWGGEGRDSETGYLHTAHAGFAALTLTAYQMRNAGLDSRFIVAGPAAHDIRESPAIIRSKIGPKGEEVTLSGADFNRLIKEAGY